MIQEVLGQQRRLVMPERREVWQEEGNQRRDVWLEEGNLLVLKGGTFRHRDDNHYSNGGNSISRVGHHKGGNKKKMLDQEKNLKTFRPSPRVVMKNNPRQPRIIRYQTNKNNKQRRGMVRDSYQSAMFIQPRSSLFNSSPFMGYSYERRK